MENTDSISHRVIVLPRLAVTHCVAMCRTLATVNHVNIFEREVELLCQSINTIFEFSILERSKFVENWLNESRIKNHGGYLKDKEEHSNVGYSKRETLSR